MKYLLRSWGADEEQVIALRPPDAYEPDDHVACWWFDSKDERERFIQSFGHVVNAMRDRVDPGEDSDGEIINTEALTVALVTLQLPDGRHGTFRMPFGYGYPEHSVRFMFTEGNYSCDCNRRDFLHEYCSIGDGTTDDDGCGDTIQLVDLVIEHEARK